MRKACTAEYWVEVNALSKAVIRVMDTVFQFLTIFLLVLVVSAGSVQAGEIKERGQPFLPKRLAHITFTGANGTDCKRAIIIRNAANTLEGVAAEKAWIAWQYPQATIKGQAVSGAGDKTFDTLEIETAGGESKTVCFDITDFFGQW